MFLPFHSITPHLRKGTVHKEDKERRVGKSMFEPGF